MGEATGFRGGEITGKIDSQEGKRGGGGGV